MKFFFTFEVDWEVDDLVNHGHYVPLSECSNLVSDVQAELLGHWTSQLRKVTTSGLTAFAIFPKSPMSPLRRPLVTKRTVVIPTKMFKMRRVARMRLYGSLAFGTHQAKFTVRNGHSGGFHHRF